MSKLKNIQNPQIRRFGIEEEHFICNYKGIPSISDLERLWANLKNKEWIDRTSSSKTIPGVQKKVEDGIIEIKPDYCTHILEISYPPVKSLNSFKQYFNLVWTDLSKSLFSEGLFVSPVSALNENPKNVILYDSCGNLERLLRAKSRNLPSRKFASPNAPALMTGFQVSVELLESDSIDFLNLYKYLFGAIELFCEKGELNGSKARKIRPLLYRDLYSDEHPALGYPGSIPNHKNYLKWLSEKDANIRDYRFVALRSKNRLEFRLSDSQNQLNEMFKIISYHLAIFDIHKNFLLPEKFNSQNFYNVCENEPCLDLTKLVRNLSKANIPNEHNPYLAECINDLSNLKKDQASITVSERSDMLSFADASHLRWDCFKNEKNDSRYEIPPFEICIDNDDPVSQLIVATNSCQKIIGTARYHNLTEKSIGFEKYPWQDIANMVKLNKDQLIKQSSRIDRCAVSKVHRGNGILGSMLNCAEILAKKENRHYLLAAIETDNHPSINGFQNSSWIPIGQVIINDKKDFQTYIKIIK
jgi:hypothetical protein